MIGLATTGPLLTGDCSCSHYDYVEVYKIIDDGERMGLLSLMFRISEYLDIWIFGGTRVLCCRTMGLLCF